MVSPSPNPSPFLRASYWSRFFHSWISQILRQSHEQETFDLVDLYDIPSHLESTKLTNRLEGMWFDEMKRSPLHPSLIRTTIRTVGWKSLLIGFLLIPTSLLSIAQPLVLTYLMNYFEPCSTMSSSTVWLLALSTVLITLCSSLIMHQYLHRTMTLAMSMRIAYTGLIYRKVLRLSSHSMTNLSSGKIVNILSNDAGQIEMALIYINYLWKTPLEILFVIIFFWKYMRYLIFIALGYALVILFIQVFCSRLILHFRAKILQRSDERVKIMSEIIKSMRLIKMYCWETALSNKVRLIRKKEILQCAFRLLLDCVQTLFSHTFSNVTFVLMYTIMWKWNSSFDTKFFAISICMLAHIRVNIIHQFTVAVRNLVNYLAAVKRIQTFLMLNEFQQDRRGLTNSYRDLRNEQRGVELICRINRASWEKNETFLLKNILFDVHPGELVCIIGPVGCGKSSLLQTLSGEISFIEGDVHLNGSFCYVPQESWIFSSTVKNNILFGKEYHPKLFQRVIDASALETDLAQWSYGINTIVGDQGVTLSGGQKARVNMARALYQDADIYLLDDPLSAVDVKVSKHLFEKSIKDYLRKKICVLVTHQIQFLQDATKIIVLANGQVTDIGTYEELILNSKTFAHLIDDIHQHQSVKLQKQLSNISVSEIKNVKEMLPPAMNMEMKRVGIVKWNVYTSYLRAGAGLCFGLILLIGVFSSQEFISVFSDRWLAKWSDEEGHRHKSFNNCTNQSSNIILSLNDIKWEDHRNNRFYTYAVTILLLIVVTLIRVCTMEFLCLNAGRVLHNKMFHRFVRAPISFFDNNPIGRMSNRFTKDISILDDLLPMSLFDLCQCVFKVLGTVILVSWLNPLSLIPSIICLIGMIYVRWCFARCLRDLKRIEGLSRSPVYSYLTSTMDGLKVIRSYGAEEMCSREFLSYLNDHSRVTYLICTVNRWSAIRFDWITVLFIGLVTMFSIIVRTVQNQLSSADIALILSYSLNLMGILQWTIRLSVDVESQMTAVERVVEYCSLEEEGPSQVSPDRRPPSTWPSHGRILFQNVSMSHSNDPNSPLALDQIWLSIESGEKVGIVGRTGAGKSSLIQSLFRMGILVHGQIQIDNIDISSVGLDDLRSRISIIPQDPVLFTGTIRNNLDPFDKSSDKDIWIALEQVQLKRMVKEKMSNGLQSIVKESGSNLSVGQKQLVCLARAILKRSQILVIDEATANVDNETDELIQKSLRNQFRECTVLTVAHRLRTVIDNDRILVLDHGHLIEFDTPSVLLSNPNSAFSSMVNQTGLAEAQYLRSLAFSTTSKDHERNIGDETTENGPLVSLDNS